METQSMLAPQRVETLRGSTQTTCCIVGAGPAGAVLALLLARQGIAVTLLESHGDFERQFRGDSLYPTVLEMMGDLGLAERLQELPHTKMDRIPIETEQGEVIPINMRTIKSPYPYIMLVAQSAFLALITAEASRYPHFRLIMTAPARELIEEEGKIRGVRYRAPDGWYEVRAELTVGADGRFSKVRSLANIPIHTIPTSMDNIWFRLPRESGDPEASFGRQKKQMMVAMLMRPDHWQITCNIPKGSYAQIRAQGLPAFRRSIVEIMPFLAERMEQITEWNQLSLLSVEMGQVSRWYRPGLLLIGDAAHVMSPALGIGVNAAVQDAIVAANVLTHPLQTVQQQGHVLTLRPLAEIQLRRKIPIDVFLALQRQQSAPPKKTSVLRRWATTLLSRSAVVKTLVNIGNPLVTRIAALGLWRVRVRYPQASAKPVETDTLVVRADKQG